MDAPWKIQLFGGLHAQRGDQAVTRFATSRVACLLARLALFPHRAHPREELIDLLWPESDLDSGRNSLRVAIASLRRQLEPPDIAPGSILAADRSAVRLNPLACRCDVLEFEAALKAAARAADPQQKRQALDQALAAYGGELLPGFYEDWIVEERERLEALHEEACSQRQNLPSVLSFSSLPALPAQSSPASLDAAPAPLGFPLQFTRFFGREKECAQAAQWLADPQTRLLTLTGPGGAGKTRLAVEAAQRAAASFAGPVCFVPLADLAEARFIPNAVAAALGLTPSAASEPMEQIVAALAAQPPALLVLDNLEHLVERGAPLVFSLLTRLPTLTCLATSRRRLSLPGERQFPLPPLPLPDAAGTPEQIALAASAQLFVDRAQAARPDFQLTRGNAALVADLCHKLEGLPLAIELVAARSLSLTPAQMAERLDQRFELLTSRRGDKGGRHRSLWAAMAWSHDLLPPTLQQFFVGLSVFRGGCAFEAAQAVCEQPQALEFLTQLRERSLILVEESGPEMRFRLLESLREFGEEHLAIEERQALARRHAAWFLSLAQDAWPQITGPDQARWLDRLEAEHDNLRLALTFWLAAEDGVEAALDMCGSLWRFWSTRGHFASGRDWLRRALERPGGAPFHRARALNGAGNLARLQGDYSDAEASYADALAIMRQLDIKTSIGACLCNLGMVAMHRENYAQARALQEEALALRREIDDRGGIAFTLECLAMVAQHQKDYVLSRRLA